MKFVIDIDRDYAIIAIQYELEYSNVKRWNKKRFVQAISDYIRQYGESHLELDSELANRQEKAEEIVDRYFNSK